MTIQDRFLQYADAFELTYQDDDWSRLAGSSWRGAGELKGLGYWRLDSFYAA